MSGQAVWVDTSRYNAALKKYLTVTSRTASDAVNGKMRDLLLNAAAYGPFNNTEFSPGDYKRNRSHPYITFKTIQRFGQNPPGSARVRAEKKNGGFRKNKGNVLGPGQKWNMVMRNVVARGLRKRHNGQRGYMSSAFIKAALMFAPIGSRKPGKRSKKRYYGKNTDGRAAMYATPRNLAAMSVMMWNAKSAVDAARKEELARMAINKAVNLEADDMEQYLARKLSQAAKSVSA